MAAKESARCTVCSACVALLCVALLCVALLFVALLFVALLFVALLFVALLFSCTAVWAFDGLLFGWRGVRVTGGWFVSGV